jgi:hypothetical protein
MIIDPFITWFKIANLSMDVVRAIVLCPHGRGPYCCVECGTGHCLHGRRKGMCVDCSAGRCQHGRRKWSCAKCGTGRCPHGRVQRCKDCGTGYCEHGKQKRACELCVLSYKCTLCTDAYSSKTKLLEHMHVHVH